MNMKIKRLPRYVSFIVLGAAVTGCGGSSSTDEQPQFITPKALIQSTETETSAGTSSTSTAPVTATTPETTTLATETDIEVLAQVKAIADKNTATIWPGFDYASIAQYLIRQESVSRPVSGFIVNPVNEIEGGQILGENENSGLSAWRYDGDLFAAFDNRADKQYDINDNIYVVSTYYKSDKDNIATFAGNAFALHQNNNWPSLANSDFNDAYPLTGEVLTLKLLSLELLKAFPHVFVRKGKKPYWGTEKAPLLLTVEQLKDILAQYVAVRREEISLDSSMSLAGGLSSYYEAKLGSQHFLITTLERALVASEKQKTYVSEDFFSKKYSPLTGFAYFYSGMFAETGAAVIDILKQLGYDLRKIEQGTSPYDAAKEVLSLSEVELDQALEKAKSHENWSAIEQRAAELSAIINQVSSS
ncbi:hypothetical protein [Thalassomonas actiniarum]|uniref:DUF4856 domain-containing protein n=1 Tax=Thalassomonas actiniarum TaxID=485447 RepID=A0AAE9YW70_9GAMM|nr:hypothetical protein [Thalassomonas actiniarum]WDE02305.1 hypothetical protein SG35_031640 [Thalassomonas actiniarum]